MKKTVAKLGIGVLILSGLLVAGVGGGGPRHFRVEVGDGVSPVREAPCTLIIKALLPDGEVREDFDWSGVRFQNLGRRNGESLRVLSDLGKGSGTKASTEGGVLTLTGVVLHERPLITWEGTTSPLLDRTVPGWNALLPPLAAIVLAILLRQVLLALFVGIWMGAWAISGGPFSGLVLTATELIPGALDADRTKILVFSCLLGAVVALVARMGGTRALVDAISRIGESRRGAQLTTWFTGILIFFDDYANALLVGTTMRPITDRHRVSREKLSFLVDCTSAPVACIFVISTWIAAEIGYIQGKLDLPAIQEATGLAADGAYQTFIATIPYNYYPILTLIFSFCVAFFQRDFGPMRRAEQRAASSGQVLSDAARPLSSREMEELTPVDDNRLRAFNAILPIGTVVLTVILGLWVTGRNSFVDQAASAKKEATILRWHAENDPAVDAKAREELVLEAKELEAKLPALTSPSVRDVFGAADSYRALLTAAFLGVLVAILLALLQRFMTLGESLDVTTAGIKAMMPAALVLIFAWGLQGVCERLNTSQWLIYHVAFTLELLPAVIFVLAAAVGFSTGTSWGTMGILVPLTIDYAVGMAGTEGLGQAETVAVMVPAIAAVLAGAVFGDHCSPISDTTIMSSMASGADHIDHVRTQLPYALTVAGVALAFGYLPAGFGFSPWFSLPAGALFIVLLVRFVGRPVQNSA